MTESKSAFSFGFYLTKPTIWFLCYVTLWKPSEWDMRLGIGMLFYDDHSDDQYDDRYDDVDDTLSRLCDAGWGSVALSC